MKRPGLDASLDQAASHGLRPPETVGFLLVPDFSMLSFSSAMEPLRAANRMSGRRLYEWRVLSPDGRAIRASSGTLVLPDAGLLENQRLDRIAVVAGLDAQTFDDKAVFGWLRRQARLGARVGAISTASYVLARAGLLNGSRCTIHWENLHGFMEDFPDLDVTSELFEIDGARFTCSGGTAAIDLMLQLIGLQHGRELATQVAEQFIHERIREAHDKQRMALRTRLGISHPKLIEVVGLMESHLDEPLGREELAREGKLSTRQLERLFRRYMGCTPTRYYLELRLQRARQLLEQTTLPVLDVGLACGFV
ncbi:MAG: GlxA family transcriptional regulator, partial [Acidobacteriota bacterium]